MIKLLTIKNWKAFENKQIKFRDGITFFVGPNGIGKTTLLEAICLSISGKSITANFQELVRNPNMPAEIKLDIEIDGKKISMKRKFRKDRKLQAEMVIDSKKHVMNWDDLTSKALGVLSVDEMFFNRLIYMSEGEIFNYLNDPPREALNTRIQEIFAIKNLQEIEEFTKTILKGHSSSIREMSSELKTITAKKPIDESQILSLDKDINKLKEKEKELYNKRDVLAKQIRDLEDEKKNCENLKILLNEIEQIFKSQVITVTTDVSFDNTLPAVTNNLETNILTEEEGLRKIESMIGSLQNKLTYLKDIKKLLQTVISGTTGKIDVPCPVCKRPIDENLANHLMFETENQINETEKELFENQKNTKNLQVKIKDFRDKLRKLRDYEIRLGTFPATIIEKIKPLTFDRINLHFSSINTALKTKADEHNKILSSLEVVKKEFDSKMLELATMKADIKQRDLLKLLENRLRTAYEGQISTEILTHVLESAVKEQRDQRLAKVYLHISHLWDKFRPESKWRIVLDDEGFIRVEGKERQYEFSHLSGGEKTVLLVLARVILCRFLAPRIDFMMIDEPLEHLDIRNRRSLLNFLVSSCKKNIIPQILVTTFEETLVKKYYDGDKSEVQFLN